MAPLANRDVMKEISCKITSSRPVRDVKEILNLLLLLFTSLQSNQNAVASLEEKIGVLESSYKDNITASEARVASLEEKIKPY